MTPNGPQCDPMGGGCKALADVRGELNSEKAGKQWVDEQVEKVNEKLDRMIYWLIGTCVSVLVGIVLLLGQFVLSLLEND